MTSYFLPMRIDNRRVHYCELLKDCDREDDNPTFEFIVPKQNAGNVVIEFFQKNDDEESIEIIPCNAGIDTSLSLKAIQLSIPNEQDNDEIHVKLLQEEATGEETFKNEISYKKIENKFQLIYTGDCNNKKKTIIFEYTKDEAVFTGTIIIHFAKESYIYEAVLDSGSEASQAVIRKFEERNSNSSPVNLINTVLSFYLESFQKQDEISNEINMTNRDDLGNIINLLKNKKAHSGITEDATLKEDSSSIQIVEDKSSYRDTFLEYALRNGFWQGKVSNEDDFFKSILAIKSNPEPKQKNVDFPGQHLENSYLHSLIPNVRMSAGANKEVYDGLNLFQILKVMRTTGDNSSTLEFCIPGKGNQTVGSATFYKETYRFQLNTFLHAILKKIRNSLSDEKDKFYCYLTLLIPNIYSQKDVYELVKDASNDLAELRKIYNCNIEILTMSESDASFMGLVKTQEMKGNESLFNKYLIIDSGKGTTDISIIEKLNSNNYTSVFRTGFAGAGQVLSYSFMQSIENLLPDLPGRKNDEDLFKISKYIKICKDISVKQEFFENIDNLKEEYGKLYRDNKGIEMVEDISTLKNIFKGIEIKDNDDNSKLLEKINEIIKKIINDQGNIKLFCAYSAKFVDENVDNLVKSIKNKISEQNINDKVAVIFSGRAFLFEPYKDKLIEELTEEICEPLSKKKSSKLCNNFIELNSSYFKKACLNGPLEHKASLNEQSLLVSAPNFIVDCLTKEHKLVQCNKGKTITLGTYNLTLGNNTLRFVGKTWLCDGVATEQEIIRYSNENNKLKDQTLYPPISVMSANKQEQENELKELKERIKADTSAEKLIKYGNPNY